MGSSSPTSPKMNEVFNINIKQIIVSNSQEGNDMNPAHPASYEVEVKKNGKIYPANIEFTRTIESSNNANIPNKKKNNSLEKEAKEIDKGEIPQKSINSQEVGEYSLFNKEVQNEIIIDKNNSEKNIINNNNNINNNNKNNPSQEIKPATDFGEEEREEKVNNNSNTVTIGGNIDKNNGGENKVNSHISNTCDIYEDKKENKKNEEGPASNEVKDNNIKETINISGSDLSISQSQVILKDDEQNKLAKSFSAIEKGFFIFFLKIANNAPIYLNVSEKASLNTILSSHYKDDSTIMKQIKNINLFCENRRLDLNKSIKYLKLEPLCLITDKKSG